MSEIGTIEGYTKITTGEATIPSGMVFKVRAMGASQTVGLMSKIPDGGLDDANMIDFISEHIDFILQNVIGPCIVEPKVPIDTILFMDVMELLNEIMVLSGFGKDAEEQLESFHERENDDSA